jgi:hypothetical protein
MTMESKRILGMIVTIVALGIFACEMWRRWTAEAPK